MLEQPLSVHQGQDGDLVVMAAGPWNQRLRPKLLLWFFLQLGLCPAFLTGSSAGTAWWSGEGIAALTGTLNHHHLHIGERVLGHRISLLQRLYPVWLVHGGWARPAFHGRRMCEEKLHDLPSQTRAGSCSFRLSRGPMFHLGTRPGGQMQYVMLYTECYSSMGCLCVSLR